MGYMFTRGHRLSEAFAAFAVLALATPAAAIADADDRIQWNGFLNVVGGILHQEGFSADNPDGEVPQRLNYTDDFSFDRETSAGLQASTALDDRTRITAQLYANGADENYAARMKWLYLTWQTSNASYLRIGKLGAPLYYYTDFLNVGYAYHWVSPPRELYQFDATLTGVAWTYGDTAGDFDWSAEVFGGSSEQYLPAVLAQTTTRNIRGLVVTLSDNEWISLRAMEMRQLFTLESELLDPGALIDAAFESAVADGTVNQATADALKPTLAPQMRPFVEESIPMVDEPMIYRQFSARIDRQRWFLLYEASTFLTDTYVYGDTKGWYLTGGYKTGDITLHLTRAKRDTPIVDQGFADWEFAQTPLAAVPFARLPEYLGRSINAEVATRNSMFLRSWIMGANIDTSANSVLKFEVVRFEQLRSVPDETKDIGSNTLFRTALCVTF